MADSCARTALTIGRSMTVARDVPQAILSYSMTTLPPRYAPRDFFASATMGLFTKIDQSGVRPVDALASVPAVQLEL